MKRSISPLHLISFSAIIIISVFLTACAFFTKDVIIEKNISEILQDAQQATVMVVSGGKILGTGVLIDDRTILTSKHILQWESYIVIFSDKKEISARLTSVHPTLDLAILQISPTKYTPIKVISSQVWAKKGDTVYAIGSLVSLSLLATHEGIISDTQVSLPQISSTWLLQVDIPFQSGYSGGPLINSRGELVGIHAAYIPNLSQWWSIPVDANMLQDWWK